MGKLNAAIMEAYEDYQTALDYVKGWKKEAAIRKAYCMALINAARKSNPELGAISAKDLFARTAEMYEAAHTPAEDQQDPEEEAADEVEESHAEVEQAPAEEESTAGEDQEAPENA